MGAAYTIFGRQVPAHILSIATLGSVAAIIAWPKGAKEATPSATPVAPVVQTKEDDFDLEKFINDLSKEESK
ncbi:putative ATP synthase K chain, mitochondrial [Scheffersomyces amazonensis]|uniref:putative ATP synthase K chain, mitochondrial n=1 Tax=Scheffersomyces amazonensis TaxID=1078765 RepID=UPI00315C553F